MTDYTKLAHGIGGACEDQADRWADAFCQICRENSITFDSEDFEGFMVGWFANAIELSHDFRINNRRIEVLREMADAIETGELVEGIRDQ